MKKILCMGLLLAYSATLAQPSGAGKRGTQASVPGNRLTLSKGALQNKIKGGWAGQTIGVTFGGPTEFKFNGTLINDYQPIVWYDGYIKKTMETIPGLYDDIYMDLTFVEVLEKEGLDAPVSSFANAFANADYMLWHANQAARYNILQGMSPPQTGHWLNNPHADDIDYQIEADFAGLMSPGMPNTASAISDKVGHIMNYGDGWYGGVYVGAMYSLAFVSDDVQYVVTEALKTIPPQSKFYRCISDVIGWHRTYPNDWKATWFEVQKKWVDDKACSDGVFTAFNIDATVNSAYIVIGLLYGKGDFSRTMDISTRCGQDSDCNPSSAGGILGTLLGYDKIPDYWKMGLKEAEPLDFKYTTTSLNDVYEIGLKHALENIRRNGGQVGTDAVTIARQDPKAVKLEQGFEGLFPVSRTLLNQPIKAEYAFEVEGTDFVLNGSLNKKSPTDTTANAYVAEIEMRVDGKRTETYKMPVDLTKRRLEIAYKYGLSKGKHTVLLKWLNPTGQVHLSVRDLIVYQDQPYENTFGTSGR